MNGNAEAHLEPGILSSYVPALVTRRLAGRRGALLEPEGDQLVVAALFADISGFTALTERLARTGPSGVEQLTELLNGCFGDLVGLVLDHGGDVVKFAGDALLALWPVGEDDLEAATVRAAHCGLAMQRVLPGSELAPGAQLSLRVGVGAGAVCAAHFGGELERWEFLIGGAAITQTIIAKNLARPGDVVLSPQAATQISDLCSGHPIPPGGRAGAAHGGALRITAVALPASAQARARPTAPAVAAALRPYIPAAILARLAAGHSDWLSELRRISVLFVQLPSLDDVAPAILRQVNGLVRAVQATLYRYEGSFNKLNIDDNGTTLVAAFGLPPLAHEDDAVRAVRAALEIQPALHRMGIPIAIGLASGRAFCGSIGSPLRREYTMIGEVVNRACRLMQAAAAEEILCDTLTRDSVGARLAFQELGSRVMKGMAEPVATFRPHGQVSTTARSQLMVGRVAERAVLTERLEALRRGQGGVVIVEGEAGIGKSRLVDDLVEQAAIRQLKTLVGAADAIASATPYHPWRPIIETLFNIADLTDGQARRMRVLDRLSMRPDLLPLAPLLGDVVALDLPADEFIGQLTGQIRADNTRQLLIGILQAAGEERPLLIVVEDAHWCDSASWALIWLVSQHLPQVLLVLAMRSPADPVPDEYQRLRQAQGCQHLRLEALPTQDVVALLRQHLGVTSIPQPVVDLIRERAEGNPFFSEELLHALRDVGAITVADGTCRIAVGADLQALSLPETVQGVVLSRIDRLAPPQQLTLKVASVIGRSFAYRLLFDVHPIQADQADLPDQLDSLRRRDLVHLESAEPELAWAFKHVITRDVTYDLMLLAQRRGLHSAVAVWYEQHHRDELPRFYPLLAYHWSQASDSTKAYQYQALAGQQALAGGAYQEAVLFLAEALTHDGPTAPGDSSHDRFQQAQLQRQLAEAHLGLGGTGEGRRHLDRALRLLGAAPPSTQGKLAASLLRQLSLQLLHRAFPARYVGRGQQRHEPLLEASRAYIRLTEVYWFANDVPSLVHASVRALNLAERDGPSPELARAYAIMCLAAGNIPLHPLARAYGRQAVQTARKAGQLWPLAYARLITSLYAIGAARWQEVEEALKEAEEIFERLGDRRLLGDARTVHGMSLLYRGQFKQAEVVFDEVHRRGSRYENRQQKIWGLLGKSVCALPAGRPDEAARLLEAAQALLTDHPDRAEQVLVYGLLAVARLRQGTTEAAQRALQTAAGIMAQLKTPTAHYLLEGYASLAEVYLSRWEAGDDTADTRRDARQACRALRRFARVFPIGEPRARLWQGLHAHLCGRPERARALWRASLAAAERLGMPFEAALTHWELGRHHSDPLQRQQHIAAARALLRELEVAESALG
jgi:class 3 adenylate cyclase/tetratricopeptide (TPR) repeat protein